MIERHRELNLGTSKLNFDRLRADEMSLHAPYLKDVVLVILPGIERTTLLHVDIEGEAEQPPGLVSVQMEDKSPLQIKMNQNSQVPVLELPVDKIDYNRSPDGLWLPDSSVRIRTGGWRQPNEHLATFEEFTRRLTGRLLQKQQDAADKARRQGQDRAA